MNPLDHTNQLNRLRSGNRPDRGGTAATDYVQLRRLVCSISQALEAMSSAQRDAFWGHTDFSRFKQSERTTEYVVYRLEKASELDELIELQQKDGGNLHEIVARLLGVRPAGKVARRGKKQLPADELPADDE